MALASAAVFRPVAHDVLAIGEVALSGDIRPVPFLSQRVAEATRPVLIGLANRAARTATLTFTANQQASGTYPLVLIDQVRFVESPVTGSAVLIR